MWYISLYEFLTKRANYIWNLFLNFLYEIEHLCVHNSYIYIYIYITENQFWKTEIDTNFKILVNDDAMTLQ